MRGEFICANGLVIPNNITIAGSKEMLLRAIQNVVAMNFYVALVRQGVFTPTLQVGDFTEPPFTDGYARVPLARNNTDWPVTGQVNSEWYVESKDLVWAPSAEWASVRRLAIVGSTTDRTGDVFSISQAFPDPVILDTLTPLPDRTFRYRIYV